MSTRTMHRLAIVIGLGLVLTSAIAPVVQAQPPVHDRSATGPIKTTPATASSVQPRPQPVLNAPVAHPRGGDLRQNVTVPVAMTVERRSTQPPEYAIKYRFNFSGVSRPVRVSFPDPSRFFRDASRTAITTTGFTRVGESPPRWGFGAYLWTPNQTARPTATVRLTAEGTLSRGSLSVIRRREIAPWLFGPNHSVRDAPTIRFVNTSGVAGASYLIMGPHTTHTVSRANETVRLVIPTQYRANLTVPPTEIVAALSNASRQLRINTRPEPVTVLVGPRPPGVPPIVDGATFGSLAIIVPSAGLPTGGHPPPVEGNAWLHEYVHTQQARSLGPRMVWYTEAEASYYARLLELNQGRVSYRQFWHSLNFTKIGTVPSSTRRWENRTNLTIGLYGGPNSTLANQSSWGPHAGELPLFVYHRGPAVLALLDAKIRRATQGRASLMNVSRAMNHHRTAEDSVTLGVFKHILRRYLSNQTVTRFIARYVTGQHPVSLPRERAVYELPPVAVNHTRPSPRPTPPPRPSPPGNPDPQPVTAVRETLHWWLTTGRTRSRQLITPIIGVLPRPIRAPVKQRPLIATGVGAFLLLAVLRYLIGH